MTSLEDQTALITGASKGLGKSVAKRFVAEGANVVVNSRSAERAQTAAKGIETDLEDDGTHDIGNAVGIAADTAEYEQVETLVEETIAQLGDIDVLVGNAGIHDDGITLEDVAPAQLNESFDELFGVNVRGYLNAAKAALPSLRETGGNVVFTASYASFNPGTGGIFYTPAKHAVVGVIRQLAYELAPEIRVNGVAPNYVPTELSGIGSLDQGAVLDDVKGAGERSLQERYELPILGPDEYAGYYVFLASDDSAASTGTVISADCGSVISN
jgi:NAD(P)-dependent dehydrogenase (short-subunit alcohol dehydrogenase family)